MPSVFEKSIPELERWRRRERLDHRKLNQSVDAINELARGIMRPQMIGGQPQRGGTTVAAGPSVGVFVLLEDAALYPDHLVCRRLSEDPNAEDFEPTLVAKPWMLWRTPFDGLERNGIRYDYTTNTERLATELPEADPPNTRTEIVSPTYIVDDWIVAGNSPSALLTVGDDDVRWIELTSRNWKVIYTTIL